MAILGHTISEQFVPMEGTVMARKPISRWNVHCMRVLLCLYPLPLQRKRQLLSASFAYFTLSGRTRRKNPP